MDKPQEPQTEAGKRLLTIYQDRGRIPEPVILGSSAVVPIRAAILDIERQSRAAVRADLATRLGPAIHEVFCHQNAPMHSAKDHSAERILSLIEAPEEAS